MRLTFAARLGVAAAALPAFLVFGACRSATPAAPPAVVAVPPASALPFAETSAALSERGGYFDSDNLVTNETSYLHVVPTLKRLGVRGGAYIGVGPDQSFSYIAAIRPTVAFMLDIRRDNLLEHLIFKAIFTRARNRVEYLAFLFGRPAPSDVAAWGGRTAPQLVAYFDTARVTAASEAAARALVTEEIRRTGVALDSTDWNTIDRFHSTFIAEGLQVRYESRGRPNRGFFPAMRELVLATDLDGAHSSYLGSEDAFQVVRALQLANRVVPVTGDLAGPKAFPAIAEWLRARGERVSALYTSNAEDYVMRGGGYPAFQRTVASLPRDSTSVIIRSFFQNFRGMHPFNIPGFRSTQLLQPLDTFAARVAKGGYADYFDLVLDGAIRLTP